MNPEARGPWTAQGRLTATRESLPGRELPPGKQGASRQLVLRMEEPFRPPGQLGYLRLPMSGLRHLSQGELAIQSVLSDTVLCFPKRGSVPRHRKPSAGRGSLFGFQNIPSQESTDIDLPEGLQIPSNSLCLPPTLPSRAVMLAPGVSASEWVLFSRGRFAAVYGADAAPCAGLCFGGVASVAFVRERRAVRSHVDP